MCNNIMLQYPILNFEFFIKFIFMQVHIFEASIHMAVIVIREYIMAYVTPILIIYLSLSII